MENNTVQHRLPIEGADYQILAGVNDANLLELARLTACRVIMRGDHLVCCAAAPTVSASTGGTLSESCEG